MSSMERRVASGILAEPSPKRTASKGLAVAGVGGLTLTFLAGLIPLVGVTGLSVLFIIIAALLFLTS